MTFNLVPLWAVGAAEKKKKILFKYATFQGTFFFYVFIGKTNEKIEFLFMVASALKSCLKK